MANHPSLSFMTWCYSSWFVYNLQTVIKTKWETRRVSVSVWARRNNWWEGRQRPHFFLNCWINTVFVALIEPLKGPGEAAWFERSERSNRVLKKVLISYTVIFRGTDWKKRTEHEWGFIHYSHSKMYPFYSLKFYARNTIYCCIKSIYLWYIVGWLTIRPQVDVSHLLNLTICCWWQSTSQLNNNEMMHFLWPELIWSISWPCIQRVTFQTFFHMGQKNLPTPANIWRLSSMWMWTIAILLCAKWLCRRHGYLTTTAPIGCDEKHNTWLNTLISSSFQAQELSGRWLAHTFPSDFIQAGAEFEKETENTCCC